MCTLKNIIAVSICIPNLTLQIWVQTGSRTTASRVKVRGEWLLSICTKKTDHKYPKKKEETQSSHNTNPEVELFSEASLGKCVH